MSFLAPSFLFIFQFMCITHKEKVYYIKYLRNKNEQGDLGPIIPTQFEDITLNRKIKQISLSKFLQWLRQGNR